MTERRFFEDRVGPGARTRHRVTGMWGERCGDIRRRADGLMRVGVLTLRYGRVNGSNGATRGEATGGI